MKYFNMYDSNKNSRKSVTPHCECCGRENPETDDDGYTVCCNELVCYGDMEFTFGNKKGVSIKSCCRAKAEAIANKEQK